ncbi:unnamed protein product, partial [Mesorhabditis belari]|uniref:Uncharacterized protein n=1 Tax=Mesorhabditis belari TaxID=2138241 RepID=A0AAF3ES39_9BILA
MFGRKLTLGLTVEPSNDERNLPENTEEIEPEPEKFEDWTESIKAALTDNPTYWPDSKEYDEIVKECTDTGSYHVNKENVSHRAEAAEAHISELNQTWQHQVESIETDSTIAELNRIDEKICQHRAGAVRFQQKQAEKMLESSKNRYGSVDIGKTVRVPIDTFELDHPTITSYISRRLEL